MKLTVEADFHVKAASVAIRLYSQEDEPDSYRQFLTLGSLCNRVAELRKPEARQLYRWNAQDRAFLEFLGRTVVPKFTPPQMRLGLFVISEERFQEWRRRFADTPGRFINRDDQRPIPPPGQLAAVTERFVLSEQDAPPGHFRIEAYIVFPDGQRTRAHELLHSVGGDPNSAVTRAELFRSELPVPWPRLVKYFNRPISTIQKAKAAEILPALLYNHLELLEGPCVVRRTAERAVAPELHFRREEHAFLVQGRLAGRPLPLSAQGTQVTSRLFVNPEGALVLMEQGMTPAVDAALRALREIAAHPQAETTAEEIRFQETPQNAAFLAELWRRLPPELRKSSTAELHGLLPMGDHAPALQPRLGVRTLGGLVKLRVDWQLGDQVVKETAGGKGFASTAVQDENGHWLTIDPAAAAAARERLLAAGLLEEDGDGTEAVLTRREAAHALRELAAQMPFALADAASRNFADGLLAEPPPELPPLPEELRGHLREYQRHGFEWMADRAFCGLGCLLADDMGLGKTLQVLALLKACANAAEEFQALVVCPGSVMGVWLAQARQFCPQLPMVALAGASEQRRRRLAEGGRKAVFVTHYALLRNDAALHAQRNYDFLVADEAHFLKNPDALATMAIKSLNARHRIALTGTPLENRLLDLWSIMDFLNHGYLGSRSDFQGRAPSPAALARRLAPLMLRRTKEAVAAELPPRTVTLLPVSLTDEQRALYDEQVVLAREAIRAGGPMEILAALTRLRELCCDPELLLKRPHDYGSAKLELLLGQCEELLANGHCVLVFSQFAAMLKIIGRRMREAAMPFQTITGETPVEQRGKIVQDFQEAEQPSVLLLSLKATGTGLTLTRADYVFLYDPWWNPAAEEQAIDRTHRIGQEKPVFAYRLVARDTVEERVLELMAAKRELFAQVVEMASGHENPLRLSREDLASLIAMKQ